MTDDQMRGFWQSQHQPSRSHESLGQIIASKNAATRRQLVTSSAVAFLALGFGVFNFWGQYFWNENTLLVSSLRALPVLSATAIHIMVCQRMAKEQQERLQLTSSHGVWLRRWADCKFLCWQSTQ